MMKESTKLLLNMSYAFRDASSYVRNHRALEIRRMGRRRYVKYLFSLR